MVHSFLSRALLARFATRGRNVAAEKRQYTDASALQRFTNDTRDKPDG
jgi:hypothetical protein